LLQYPNQNTSISNIQALAEPPPGRAWSADPAHFLRKKNLDTNLPRSPCPAQAANEPNLRASSPAAPKRFLKRGRADFSLAAKNRPAPAAPKTCQRVLEPKLLAGAPEPALARQDPIGGAGSTRQLCPDISAPCASECGRGQRFL
jgi:hypothetical protein